MVITELAKNKKDFKMLLTDQRVLGKRVFSDDEAVYLSDCNYYEAVEFKQEDETENEFMENVSKWLHERPKRLGHVDYYVLVYLKKDQRLTDSQLEYLERNVAECFDTSHGWLCEINHRLRFRLRILLISSYKNDFRRLTRKQWKD